MTWIAVTMISFGLFFVLSGAVGLLRLPDFYSRLHALGKSDTLGVMLILGGVLFLEEFSFGSLRIFFIIFFIAAANPTATHALGRAAFRAGLKPNLKERKKKDE